jgi:hypothetical protein
MKAFKSIVIVNAPLESVWTTVRDRLPDLVTAMEDIEKVVVVERTETEPGRVCLTNEWYAKMRVPEILRSRLQADAIGWTDSNEWIDSNRMCTWSIAPWVLRDYIHCSGVTRYGPAIGGRGTRVTFEGDFQLGHGGLSGLAGALSAPLSPLVESIVTTLIPKNLRKVVEAAAKLHETQSRADSN